MANSAASTKPLTEFESAANRVDKAIAEVRSMDQRSQERALALKSAVEEFHRAGLVQIVKTLKGDSRGRELLFELVDLPEVYALLAMHGIVRPDLRTRVAKVVENLRPYMQSHGGDVELAEVTRDTVFVKLAGSCNGCSMSAITLRNGLEEALKEQVPEIKKIEVIPQEPGPALIPLEALTGGKQNWIAGPPVEILPEGRPFRFDHDSTSVLLLRTKENIVAFQNMCAHQGLPLEGGMVDCAALTITCPWHGFRYDFTTGECLTAPQAQLEMFPLRVEDGIVKLRFP